MGDMHDHDARFAAGEHLEEDDFTPYHVHIGTIQHDPTKPRWKPPRIRLRKALFLTAGIAWTLLVFSIWVQITGMTVRRFVTYMNVVMEWIGLTSPGVIVLMVGWFALVWLYYRKEDA